MRHYHWAPTYLCSELVKLYFVDALGRRRRVTANLEEIAPRRLALLVEAAIPNGALATVEARGQQLRGFARKVAYDPRLGWFVEIGLEANSTWSRRMYTPEHMVGAPLVRCRRSASKSKPLAPSSGT